MSYILEALQKSERERNHNKVPSLQTSPMAFFDHRRTWVGILIGIAALLSVALFVWLIGVEWFHAATRQESVVTLDDDAESRVSVPKTTQVESAEHGRKEMPEKASRDVDPSPTEDLGQMDEDVRARIEDLSVSVISYSEVPARRFVMFNQRILRESDSVTDGVVVKRILPKSVLLSVDNHEIVIRPD